VTGTCNIFYFVIFLLVMCVKETHAQVQLICQFDSKFVNYLMFGLDLASQTVRVSITLRPKKSVYKRLKEFTGVFHSL
jgi:hypothetical protein